MGLPIAAAVLVAAGLFFGYSDLIVLGCAGLIAAVGSLVWVASRPPLRVQRRVEPARVVRGQECLGVVQIRNGSRWRSAALVGEDHCAGRDFEADQPLQPIRLAPREEITTTYQVPTRRRGIVDVGPLRIARRDPLGLVRLSWPYGKSARVWVHPRVYPLLHVPVGTNRSLDGVVDKVQHGSITFHALREYVAGDDLRHVHWRTSAHIGQLMVREHVDTSLPRIAVVLDDRPEVYDGDGFEDAVDAAASVVTAIVGSGLTVDLHLASGSLIEGGPDIGVQPLLDLLSEVQPTEGTSFGSVLQRLRHRRRGDTAIMLTGSGSSRDGVSGELNQTAALSEVYPTVVIGAFGGVDLPAARLPGVTLIPAADAAAFADGWNAVPSW
jgi:uncharacterized protein (DUF58 family)